MASAAAPALSASVPAEPQPLTGVRLIVAAFALALANFVVVLDTTIANRRFRISRVASRCRRRRGHG